MAPDWVLDAVIVHELAHLLEPNHSPRFRALESRYPRRNDADAFLEGYALGLAMPGTTLNSDAGAECDGDSPLGRRRRLNRARVRGAPDSRLQRRSWLTCWRRSQPWSTP